MKPDKKTDKLGASAKDVVRFLFGPHDSEGDGSFLDMRTHVPNNAAFNALLYYRILQVQFNCAPAKLIADRLELLLIASGGSRNQAVAVLLSPMPKQENIIKGLEEALKRAQEEGEY